MDLRYIVGSLEDAFVLYGTFSVIYSGRAESELERGQYLIVHKIDGTLLVHGSTNITARNYQGPGSKLEVVDNSLISHNKSGESLTIIIHRISNVLRPVAWSRTKIKLSKSERDLVNKIIAEMDKYIPNSALISIEHQTRVGPIDIYVVDINNQEHVIEVKRGKASLASGSQLARYLGAFPKAVGYLMSPNISKNAEIWCQEHNIKYVRVEH
jgi:RecB family endonuclease NucS